MKDEQRSLHRFPFMIAMKHWAPPRRPGGYLFIEHPVGAGRGGGGTRITLVKHAPGSRHAEKEARVPPASYRYHAAAGTGRTWGAGETSTRRRGKHATEHTT